MGEGKGEKFSYVHLNPVTLAWFVGCDPEQRLAKGNISRFTVLSIATNRSWKKAVLSGARKPSGIAQ